MKQKAKPKKSASFLIINGKDNKSELNKRTVLKNNALKKPKRTLKIKNPKAPSTLKKRPVSSKSTKRIVLEKSALKTPKRSLKMKIQSNKASSTPQFFLSFHYYFTSKSSHKSYNLMNNKIRTNRGQIGQNFK